jgi:hypothetical protein
MKWVKKFEDFKGDELEVEMPIDEMPDSKKIENNSDNSKSYLDKEGIVQISDWNKY